MQNRENKIFWCKMFFIILFLPFILLALVLSLNHLHFIYIYHKTRSEIIIKKNFISGEDISYLRKNSEIYCEYFEYSPGWGVLIAMLGQKKFESLLKISKKEFMDASFIYVKKNGVDYLYNSSDNGYCVVNEKLSGE